jgi:hypothetical protein
MPNYNQSTTLIKRNNQSNIRYLPAMSMDKTQPRQTESWSHFVDRGEMSFLQKIKFLPNAILMLETFRYILSHVKYEISAKNSTGKATVFEIQHIFR